MSLSFIGVSSAVHASNALEHTHSAYMSLRTAEPEGTGGGNLLGAVDDPARPSMEDKSFFSVLMCERLLFDAREALGLPSPGEHLNEPRPHSVLRSL
eukprot:4045109-Pleurochrysis_carterae.AAC.1